MKSIKKYILKYILLYPILYTLIIVSLHYILTIFGLMFREWVYYLSVIIVIVGLIIGIIQLILKIKIKTLKVIGMCIFSILLLLILPKTLFLISWTYEPEYIVNVDRKKYVVYESGFTSTNLTYYEYKNIFVVGNKIIMEKTGNGVFNPKNNTLDSEYDTIYY